MNKLDERHGHNVISGMENVVWRPCGNPIPRKEGFMIDDPLVNCPNPRATSFTAASEAFD